VDLQKRSFAKLFRSARVWQLNAGTATLTDLVKKVLETVQR
jgi:hypothetical protein